MNIKDSGNDNHFKNVFETGLLTTNNQSKYDWHVLQDEGNGVFYREDELPKTFVKSEGKQGRPNVPEWKKNALRERGLVVATRAQDHPNQPGVFGCLVYVKPNNLASTRVSR